MPHVGEGEPWASRGVSTEGQGEALTGQCVAAGLRGESHVYPERLAERMGLPPAVHVQRSQRQHEDALNPQRLPSSWLPKVPKHTQCTPQPLHQTQHT